MAKSFLGDMVVKNSYVVKERVPDMLQARVDSNNSCAYLFYQYDGTSLDVKNLDTSRVTNMLQMFAYCYNLTSLDLSHFDMSKVTVTQSMLRGCYLLTNLILPSTIKEMDSYFIYECYALTEFTILAETPPTLADTTSCIGPTTTSIYVPDASVDAYKTATNWSTYADRIKPLSSKPA